MKVKLTEETAKKYTETVEYLYRKMCMGQSCQKCPFYNTSPEQICRLTILQTVSEQISEAEEKKNEN